MAKSQSAQLERKKLLGDPILITTIVVLIAFLTLFILYPLAILMVDSVVSDNGISFDVFTRILALPSFDRAITNTLRVGFAVGILSALIGLLFAYVYDRTFPRGFHASCCFSAICSLSFHDYDVWQERPDYSRSFRNF